MIGDVVNLAARIEKLNKQFDSQLLISEMVWQAVNEDRRKAVPMGEVQGAWAGAGDSGLQVA